MVNDAKDKLKIICFNTFNVPSCWLNTGPELESSALPGCNPPYILGAT